MGCCEGRPRKVPNTNNYSSGSYNSTAEGGMKGPPNLRKASASLYKSHSSVQNYSSKSLVSKTEELLFNKRKLLEANEDTKNLQVAKDCSDILTIIDFMSSEKKIQIDIEIEPPWAEHPKSIGSLAIVYLGLAYTAELGKEVGKGIEEERSRLNEKLLKKKIDRIISQNLKSQELDRNELTILLLIVTLDENVELTKYLYAAGIFPTLVAFIGPNNPNTKKPNKNELRMGALQATREFLRDQPRNCELFCNDEGIEFLKLMLEDSQDAVVFEGLIFVDEIITENSSLNTRNSKTIVKLVELGFVRLLKKVIDVMSSPLPETAKQDPEALELRQNSRKYANFLLDHLNAYNSLN